MIVVVIVMVVVVMVVVVVVVVVVVMVVEVVIPSFLVARAFLVSCFWSTFEKNSFRLGKSYEEFITSSFDHDGEILVVGGL